MNEYDGKIGTATHLLSHYLRTAWEAAGLRWDSDNDSEVQQIIEAIKAMAKDDRVEGLEGQVESTKANQNRI